LIFCLAQDRVSKSQNQRANHILCFFLIHHENIYASRIDIK
jgi:hypothetical protein